VNVGVGANELTDAAANNRVRQESFIVTKRIQKETKNEIM
jgi:hypothetical protein